MRDVLEDVPPIAWVIVVIVALGLAYGAPVWLAGHFGYMETYHHVQAWVMGQKPWIKASVIGAYVLGVVFIVVAAVAAVVTTIVLVCKGVFSATASVARTAFEAVSLVLVGVGKLVVLVCEWAGLVFVKFFEWCEDLYNGWKLDLRFRREDREENLRLYHEHYSHCFSSFRRFLRYVDAIEKGEELPPFDDVRCKREEKEERDFLREELRKASAYQEAVRLFGLADGFDEADLDRRYRVLMKRAHPDVGGANETATKLNRARDLIKEVRGWG